MPNLPNFSELVAKLQRAWLNPLAARRLVVKCLVVKSYEMVKAEKKAQSAHANFIA